MLLQPIQGLTFLIFGGKVNNLNERHESDFQPHHITKKQIKFATFNFEFNKITLQEFSKLETFHWPDI
jgi:hypothetical protein